jgi:hypothetical protein
MHIPDWDPDFLAEYSPAGYAELLSKAGVQSAVIYANSHVGLNYYPTTTGKAHKNTLKNDVFKETIERCSGRGINVVAYYSVIFNNWAKRRWK